MGEDFFSIRLKSHHNSSQLFDQYVKKQKKEKNDFLEKLEQVNQNKKAIYVHTPFCDKICSFCNLNRSQLDGQLDDYTQLIIKELKTYAQSPYVQNSLFDAIYFGGGTPTVYNEEQIEEILKTIRKYYNLSDDYEMTFETTLHNLKRKKLEVMKNYGVNRLSIGIQTFSDSGRKFYNRTYKQKTVLQKLHELRNHFDGDICTDIIYNYPNQTIEDVRNDAKLIKEMGMSSTSFYSLMIHKGSVLSKDKKIIENQGKDLIYEKKLFDIFLNEILKNDDYYILELTKVAKRNKDRYQYIKIRHAGGDTLPIGLGAGGNISDLSIFNMNKDQQIYMKSTEEHMRYKKISSFFQFPNIRRQDILSILNENEQNIFFQKINNYKKRDFLEESNQEYQLTRNGIFWGHNITKDIVQSLIRSKYS